MLKKTLFLNFFLLITITLGDLVIAKPYYFFQQAAEPASQDASTATKQETNQIAQVVGDVANGANGGEKLPNRIHNHLNQLYQHGSTAVKSLAHQVQPDIKNIGQDISEAYQVTRDNVGKRIEPIAQTVRPFIDHAQKVVAPYIHQVEQEVPKLMHQAGPAISKVGEQVRDGITGVWHKVKANVGPTDQLSQSGAQDVADATQQVAQQANQQMSAQTSNQALAAAV